MITAEMKASAIAHFNPDGEFYRIVVVRGDPGATNVYRRILELLGHEAAAANDGQAGLQLVQAMKPDIVLCATDLAKLDSFEVAREIRRTMPRDRPYLIAHTGYDQKQIRSWDTDRVFDAVLTIPNRLEEFTEAFKKSGKRPTGCR
jgi:CheY-like chemotaxis protein